MITDEGILHQPPVGRAQAATKTVAFEALVEAEYERVRRLAWRFGVLEADLDDTVQEIFTKCWAAWRGFREDCTAATWLTRIAVNHLISQRREAARHMNLLSSLLRSRVDGREPERHETQIRESYEKAVECVHQLRPKLRAVFVLRYLEEMSCREVAQTLGLQETTVRTRLFQARSKLRLMLRGYEP